MRITLPLMLGLHRDQRDPRLQGLPERVRRHQGPHRRRPGNRRPYSIAMTVVSGFTTGDYAYQMANATVFFVITVAHRPAPTLDHARKERPLMSVQPALVVETVEATEVLEGVAPKPAKGRFGMERVNWTGTIILILCAITVLLPLYVTVTMAFKTSAQAVDGNAFSLPAPFSVEGFVAAWDLDELPGRGVHDLGAGHRGHRRRDDLPRGVRLVRDRPQLGSQALPLLVLLPARGDVHPVPGRRPAADPADRTRRARQPRRRDHPATSCSS